MPAANIDGAEPKLGGPLISQPPTVLVVVQWRALLGWRKKPEGRRGPGQAPSIPTFMQLLEL